MLVLEQKTSDLHWKTHQPFRFGSTAPNLEQQQSTKEEHTEENNNPTQGKQQSHKRREREEKKVHFQTRLDPTRFQLILLVRSTWWNYDWPPKMCLYTLKLSILKTNYSYEWLLLDFLKKLLNYSMYFHYIIGFLHMPQLAKVSTTLLWVIL